MTNHYRSGRDFEHRVRDDLLANGYFVVRAAGSKTKADLIAIKPGQALIVQCKRTALPSPAERAEIVRIAACLPGVGVPVIARKGPRGVPVAYERLLTAKAADREPFSPDALT